MRLIKQIAFYSINFIVGTALFIILFHTPVFRSIDVLFYRGIVLLTLVCFVVTGALILFRKSLKDIYLVVLTIFAVNMLFFTHVPVTAERSISIFLLGYMNKNANKIVTKEDLTQVFLREYMGAEDNIQKRIHEQIVSGDITPQGSGYRLTAQGKLLMKIYGVVDSLFGIDKKLIAPK